MGLCGQVGLWWVSGVGGSLGAGGSLVGLWEQVGLFEQCFAFLMHCCPQAREQDLEQQQTHSLRLNQVEQQLQRLSERTQVLSLPAVSQDSQASDCIFFFVKPGDGEETGGCSDGLLLLQLGTCCAQVTL